MNIREITLADIPALFLVRPRTRENALTVEELHALPEGANMGLSCGNPAALAALKPGEVVLDLGSGGGFDVFIAGRKVGQTGRAIGVDKLLP